jgi:hypothetical protein
MKFYIDYTRSQIRLSRLEIYANKTSNLISFLKIAYCGHKTCVCYNVYGPALFEKHSNTTDKEKVNLSM